MTTTAFLLNGIQEGNPVVRLALDLAPHPIAGLVGVKLAALGLGAYCWFRGRSRLLTRVNLLFAFVVAWNLAALIVRSAQTA